jgi:putative transposase
MDNFSDRTFFVTIVTAERWPIFRSARAAKLFLETLLSYRDRGFFQLYEFVVMPDHVHLMLAPKATLALERVL